MNKNVLIKTCNTKQNGFQMHTPIDDKNTWPRMHDDKIISFEIYFTKKYSYNINFHEY